MDAGLSAEILKWAQSEGGGGSRMPPRGRLLAFRDPPLERAYLEAAHQQGRRYIVVTMGIICLIVVSFLWTDPYLLPPGALGAFRAARIWALIPLCVLLTCNALWITNAVVWVRQCSLLVVLFGLVHPYLLLVVGNGVFDYLELGVLELILGIFLVLGLPLRAAVLSVLVICIPFGAVTLYVESSASPFINFCVDFCVYSTLGIAAAYRYEDISRRAFVAQALSRKEYAERLAADADRRRWLEVIAGFLRHELRNSMTAIGTSIELADRAGSPSEAGKYLERGRRSLKYMSVLLGQVADATSLEAALARHEFARLELSGLVVGRVEEFRADNPGRLFEAEVAPDIHILGHGDSLTQMLDKVINNALEHGDPTQPIRIALHPRGQFCRLSVSDVGDPLPGDASAIFEPFVTGKTTRVGAANLGLGLFVARAIVLHHGGSIHAEGLAHESGARFLIELPCAPREPSARDPAVAAPALRADPVKAGVQP